ncbi:MAG: SDR family oxidoreductase, partial [Pseudomonadota bacterium]
MTQASASSTLFDLTGRVACVTGATSGLGRRAASVLARAGAAVVGVARRETALQEWRAEAGGQTATVASDVSVRGRLNELAQAVAEPFGAPDILVHAAGINTREKADSVTPEGWDKTLSLNLTAPFFLSQSLAPAMA